MLADIALEQRLVCTTSMSRMSAQLNVDQQNEENDSIAILSRFPASPRVHGGFRHFARAMARQALPA